MRKPLMLAIALAGLGAAGLAVAEEDGCRAPMADWQSREAVEQLADSRGWRDGRIKTEDGCYTIQARDFDGRKMKARVDPATLAILGVAHEHEDEDNDGEDDDDGGQGPRAAPAGTVAPPDNGLFRKGGAGVVAK
ncbi:MAG: PepSY domain-containing protein [Rhodobacteraceae bacterium]|nr:PepSY domain-containing protein [Paracoccaceae bacterium]